MKKIWLLIIMMLFTVSAFSQSTYIVYSRYWENSQDQYGYTNVKMVFDFIHKSYYKVVEGEKNPTYSILTMSKDWFEGERYVEMKVYSYQGIVGKVIITNTSVIEFFYDGSYQIIYYYDYESY